jgi:hypothetical protein
VSQDADALAGELLELTVALTCQLHEAIEHLQQPGHFPPAGLPTAAVFDHPVGAEAPRHRAGAASPQVAALAAEAAGLAHDQLGYGRRDGNPLLPALALAAFYVIEARRSDLLALGRAARGRIVAGVVEPDLARHEPVVSQGAAVLRVWFPVEGAPDACVQLRFPSIS